MKENICESKVINLELRLDSKKGNLIGLEIVKYVLKRKKRKRKEGKCMWETGKTVVIGSLRPGPTVAAQSCLQLAACGEQFTTQRTGENSLIEGKCRTKN